MKRGRTWRPLGATRPLTETEYHELIQARVDKARADFTIAQRLAEEARQRFGVEIDLSGEDE